MNFNNIYFINGTAYAGKSTMVKLLAQKHNGIACLENYQDSMLAELPKEKFPCLTYTRDLVDWRDFIRSTPDEYEDWVEGCNRECTTLELRILKQLDSRNQKIFVDTNIPVRVLKQIAKQDHVLIMLADPEVSVSRFFDRPDREKQFLYQLLLKEENPVLAMENFRACLRRSNSDKKYNEFLNSGFPVILRDEQRSAEETLFLAEKLLDLRKE